MKRHLLIAALAIVALGGAVASTVNKTSDPVAGPLNSTSLSCAFQTLECEQGTSDPCTVNGIGQNENIGFGVCTEYLIYTGN